MFENIQPNFEPLENFTTLPVDQMALRILLHYGWIVFAAMFFVAGLFLWLHWRRQKFYAKHEFVMLAIDIPRANEQSPKAVENMFQYVSGMAAGNDFLMTWWDGWSQISTSFEIISIDGYIQFLVRVTTKWKDLIESAVYSQYPDAEIAEVEDYVHGVPKKYPDEEYDMFGWDWYLSESSALPIRTYIDFEHQLSSTEAGQFKDPMSGLMSLMSSLGKGEQLWLQFVLTPIPNDWTSIGEKEIDKLLKANTTTIGGGEGVAGTPMLSLSPKDKIKVDAIQEKISKSGFRTRIRMLYFASNEIMAVNKPKVINGFAGYMRQLSKLDVNNIRPDFSLTVTGPGYFFANSTVKRRKAAMMFNYINRADYSGKLSSILNVEEMATLWHFPVESAVKVPTVKKVEGKKVEAPMILPVHEEDVVDEDEENIFKDNVDKSPATDNVFGIDMSSSPEDVDDESAHAEKSSEPVNLPAFEHDPRSEEFEIDEESEDDEDAKVPSNLPIG